jgi:hypothetical protein
MIYGTEKNQANYNTMLPYREKIGREYIFLIKRDKY